MGNKVHAGNCEVMQENKSAPEWHLCLRPGVQRASCSLLKWVGDDNLK